MTGGFGYSDYDNRPRYEARHRRPSRFRLDGFRLALAIVLVVLIVAGLVALSAADARGVL